jgi:hypothetical protein
MPKLYRCANCDKVFFALGYLLDHSEEHRVKEKNNHLVNSNLEKNNHPESNKNNDNILNIKNNRKHQIIHNTHNEANNLKRIKIVT